MLEKGFSVTLRAYVDRHDLSRTVEEFLREFRGEVPFVPPGPERPYILASLLAQRLKSYSYENIMNLEILSFRKDPEKHLLSLSLKFSFDEDLYERCIAPGIEAFLEKISEDSEFPRLLEKEGPPVICHVLGKNGRIRSYSLPLKIADPLARALGFSSENILRRAAFPRAWLHLSLLDENGREIERIPLELSLTNAVAFLVQGGSLSVPEKVLEFRDKLSGKKRFSKSSEELVFAPLFGSVQKTGIPDYFTEIVQAVSFELPGDLFKKAQSVFPTLCFERW